MRINRNQVVETAVFKFTAEASTLGLKPGEWPEMIETDIGNGYPFVKFAVKKFDGELFSVIYRQAHGCCDLAIIND